MKFVLALKFPGYVKGVVISVKGTSKCFSNFIALVIRSTFHTENAK